MNINKFKVELEKIEGIKNLCLLQCGLMSL